MHIDTYIYVKAFGKE